MGGSGGGCAMVLAAMCHYYGKVYEKGHLPLDIQEVVQII